MLVLKLFTCKRLDLNAHKQVYNAILLVSCYVSIIHCEIHIIWTELKGTVSKVHAYGLHLQSNFHYIK